jgi:pSer/pThr/pTyr-binding forkhead associated (FHA) protein
MPTLIMLNAAGAMRRVDLKPHESSIGRGTQNDIVIDSEQASRLHAVIDVEPAFVTIRDLGSRNGTFVDDVRIESQVLAHGDTIRLGSYEMRFVASDQEFSQIEAPPLLTVPAPLLDLEGAEAPTVFGAPLSSRGEL